MRKFKTILPFPSHRSNQEPTQPTPIQPSNTDPNIKKSPNPNKARNKMNAKKQQQLRKLEEIASKYKERSEKYKEDKAANKKDKSQIPVPKKAKPDVIPPEIEKKCNDDDKTLIVVEEAVVKDVEIKAVKKNKTVAKQLTSVSTKERKVIEKKKTDNEKKNCPVKKETKKVKLIKENSMSLDSLEENQSVSGGDKNCQSIGINTELMCPCIPCVIYDNPDLKASARKTKKNAKDKNFKPVADEPKVELLYKNLTMVSSCDLQEKVKTEVLVDLEDHITDSNINIYLMDGSTSENNKSDDLVDPVSSIPDTTKSDLVLKIEEDHNYKNLAPDVSNPELVEQDTVEDHDLSAEHFDENYEHDISHDSDNSRDNKYDDMEIENEENGITSRHGSGDTYTVNFSENPADLEEFINITDKMMSSHFDEQKLSLEKDLESLHTPKTNSLETIRDTNSDKVKEVSESSKYTFSDTFKELKNDLKHLMESGGEQALATEVDQNSEINRKVCDMEHITVYQLKFYEQKPLEDNKSLKNVTSEFKLPSITETNKPERKTLCNKNRIQNIYKSNRKFKMLGEQNRTNTEYQTFIVKENEDDKSDEQSITSEAPPLKLPRIENKRL